MEERKEYTKGLYEPNKMDDPRSASNSTYQDSKARCIFWNSTTSIYYLQFNSQSLQQTGKGQKENDGFDILHLLTGYQIFEGQMGEWNKSGPGKNRLAGFTMNCQ